MHNPNDTIYAVATPMTGPRKVLRITGPKAREACRHLVREAPWPNTRGIFKATLDLHGGLFLEGQIYLFPAPRSYTGQDVVEIHLDAGLPVLETLIQGLLKAGLRQAGPGEFTARAYLNGKIDLSQAEAVNEVISSSNHIQCRAAEHLLQGRPSALLEAIQSRLLDVLSLIEAGLDFSEEDVPVSSPHTSAEVLKAIRGQLEDFLSRAFETDTLAHLPSVGLAGTPNAGKSTLFNALVGGSRSIVSDLPRTTRDVLEAVLDLPRGRYVLFDCAGLLLRTEELLDQLAQQAAIQSLQRADLIVRCVDLAKGDWREDLAVGPRKAPDRALYVATKADLISPPDRAGRLEALGRTFDRTFIAVSAKTGKGLPALQAAIQERLSTGSSLREETGSEQAHMMLTARLRQAVAESINHLHEAAEAMEDDRSEIAAMTVRAAYQALSDTQHPVDEKVLDILFSRFCIGK